LAVSEPETKVGFGSYRQRTLRFVAHLEFVHLVNIWAASFLCDYYLSEDAGDE
jgi:hypothetical protein